MIGGGTRHEYPHGKPAGLGFLEIAGALVVICFVLFASRGPVYSGVMIAAVIGYVILHSRLLSKYESDGLAVWIPRKLTIVRFHNRKPIALVLLGHSSILLIAVLLLFCFVPAPQAVSNAVIIAAGAALIAVAILYGVFERRYVRSSDAVRVEIKR